MKSYRQTPGRTRQKSLFVAKGSLASMRSQLNGLMGNAYLTGNLKYSLRFALVEVSRALQNFNKEVGWPCKDDKE